MNGSSQPIENGSLTSKNEPRCMRGTFANRVSNAAMLWIAFLAASLVEPAPNIGSVHGATVVMSEPEFQAGLESGYYLETFERYPADYMNVPSPQRFADEKQIFAYTVSSDSGDDLYVISSGAFKKAISLLNAHDALVVNFETSSITAVGAQFFTTDHAGEPTPGSVTLYLSDGTSITVSNDSKDLGHVFRGFFSDVPIAWLKVCVTGTPDALQWPSISRLYVGTAIPEPGTYALVMWGLVAVILERVIKRNGNTSQ